MYISDAYSVLGLSTNASDDDVKKAYRKLSRIYHPDANVNNPNKDMAEEKFKEVQTAYKYIMDKDKNAYGEQSSRGFGSFYEYAGGRTQGFQREQSDEERYINAALNYIRSGSFNEAINVIKNIDNKSAKWYYVSALANSGLGNHVAALEHMEKAVDMEPNNMEYSNILYRMKNGNGYYQDAWAGYGGFGMPKSWGSNYCFKLCLANMLCNCFFGGGGFCC